MSKKSKFEKQLKSLLARHQVTVHESDQYNGKDMYIGTDQYFRYDGETDYEETVYELIRRIVDETRR
jgi:hypothetical protein